MPDDPAEAAIVVLMASPPAAAGVNVIIREQALRIAVQMAFAFHRLAARRLSGVEVGILDGHGARPPRDMRMRRAGSGPVQPLQRNQSPPVLEARTRSRTAGAASRVVAGAHGRIRRQPGPRYVQPRPSAPVLRPYASADRLVCAWSVLPASRVFVHVGRQRRRHPGHPNPRRSSVGPVPALSCDLSRRQPLPNRSERGTMLSTRSVRALSPRDRETANGSAREFDQLSRPGPPGLSNSPEGGTRRTGLQGLWRVHASRTVA